MHLNNAYQIKTIIEQQNWIMLNAQNIIDLIINNTIYTLLQVVWASFRNPMYMPNFEAANILAHTYSF